MLDVFRRFIAPLVPPYQYRITLYRSSNAISELSGFVALVEAKARPARDSIFFEPFVT